MKKFILAAAVLLGSMSAALAGNYPPLPLMSGPIDPSAGYAPLNGVIQSINTNSTGLIFAQPTQVTSAAAATTQALGSYTIPAGWLANIGQSIRVTAIWTGAANANVKTPLITFGTFTWTGTALGSGGIERGTCVITKTGASTQAVVCEGLLGATAITPAYAAGTSTDTAGIAVTASVTQGTASADTTLNAFLVESLR